MKKVNVYTPPQSSLSQEEKEQLIYVYQLLKEQQKALLEQINLLDQQASGTELSRQSMNAMKEIEKDHELIIPLGTSAFAKARMEDPSRVLIAISKDIIIEKNLEDGLKTMERYLENFKKIREKLVEQLKDVDLKLQQLEPQLRRMYAGTGF